MSATGATLSRTGLWPRLLAATRRRGTTNHVLAAAREEHVVSDDEEYREPYSWDAVEIGMMVGHIAALDQKRRSKKRNPIGFAAPTKPTRLKKGSRKPGSWPEVPYFDIGGE